MTAHVFIVGDKTFPVHLQHQFAGIGATDRMHIDFNGAAESAYNTQTEDTLAGMIADISRVRKGDRILFYLLQNRENKKKFHEGRFYGIFRATEDAAFLDNGGKNQHLLAELGKSLTFRILFEPGEVYPEGVTEWDALDSIREIKHPHQMLWSLIYRKLRAHRGCSMITPYEEERLCGLIRHGQQPINHRGRGLDFDAKSRILVLSESAPLSYSGNKTPFSLMPRIEHKYAGKHQFEKHLHAQIVGQFGRKGDELTRLLVGEHKPDWLGNEVGCGVGMQSIDVMVSYAGQHRYIMPIELKTTLANADHIRQIRRYVDWIEQYYLPNCPSIIAPVLITRARIRPPRPDFIAAVRQFNEDKKGRTCEPLRLVEFNISGGKIIYQNPKMTQ